MKALQKQVKELKQMIEQQQARIDSLSPERNQDYLAQVFMTRDEYPDMDCMTKRLSDVEARMVETEKKLLNQVNTIEAETVDQRRLIEKIQRRRKAFSLPAIGTILQVLSGTFTSKSGSLGSGRKRKKKK